MQPCLAPTHEFSLKTSLLEVGCKHSKIFEQEMDFLILAKKVNEPLLKVGARESEAALPSSNSLGITSNASCYILL